MHMQKAGFRMTRLISFFSPFLQINFKHRKGHQKIRNNVTFLFLLAGSFELALDPACRVYNAETDSVMLEFFLIV